MLKSLILAFAVLCGLAGATIVAAGFTAQTASACEDGDPSPHTT